MRALDDFYEKNYPEFVALRTKVSVFLLYSFKYVYEYMLKNDDWVHSSEQPVYEIPVLLK